MVDSKRLIPGFLLIFIFSLFYIFKLDNLLILLLFFLSTYELVNTKTMNYKIAFIYSLSFMVFLIFYEYSKFYNLYYFLIFLSFLLFFFLSRSLTKLFFSLIILISFIFLKDLISNDRHYFFTIIILSFFNDTMAYISGKYFKGPLIIPSISPNKTWSGTLTSFILTFLLMLLLDYEFIFSLILSSLFFVGDLFFSYYKRIIKIKDFSKLLYGHGGILDRFDSIFFPVIMFNFYFFIL